MLECFHLVRNMWPDKIMTSTSPAIITLNGDFMKIEQPSITIDIPFLLFSKHSWRHRRRNWEFITKKCATEILLIEWKNFGTRMLSRLTCKCACGSRILCKWLLKCKIFGGEGDCLLVCLFLSFFVWLDFILFGFFLLSWN